jgi:hypothetical protein
VSIDYDPAPRRAGEYNLDLREPNQQALDAIAKALDGAEPGASSSLTSRPGSARRTSPAGCSTTSTSPGCATSSS